MTNHNQRLYTARTVSLVLFGLLMVLVAGTKQAAAAETTITYAIPNTVAAIPVYVAVEKGFWADEGLNVKTQMFSAGRLAVDALLSGSVEVMSVSETPLVLTMLQGHAIYIVGTVTRHQETKFIGRRDRGITGPDTLKGKILATLPGTNSDYFMYRLLEAQHIAKRDVNIVSLQPPNMVSALVRGDIAGYFAWEPHIYYAQQQLGANALVIGPSDLYYGRHCVAMMQEFVKKNPDVVVKLLAGLVKAEDYIHANPSEAKAIVAKYTNTTEAIVELLWPEYDVRVELDDKLLDILKGQARWALTEDGRPADPPQLRRFIYTDGLLKVQRDFRTIP